MSRTCTRCELRLPGRRSHGWVGNDGAAVFCDRCAEQIGCGPRRPPRQELDRRLKALQKYAELEKAFPAG